MSADVPARSLPSLNFSTTDPSPSSWTENVGRSHAFLYPASPTANAPSKDFLSKITNVLGSWGYASRQTRGFLLGKNQGAWSSRGIGGWIAR